MKDNIPFFWKSNLQDIEDAVCREHVDCRCVKQDRDVQHEENETDRHGNEELVRIPVSVKKDVLKQISRYYHQSESNRCEIRGDPAEKDIRE